MRTLVYSMGVSLDGYIAGPGGEIDWAAPAEDVHRFHNEQARATGVQLYGRRLYETMQPWQGAADDPARAEHEREFARVWEATPKVVFSTTLDRVEGNARLAERDAAAEVAALKEEPGQELAVGGAGLASSLARLGLVDEYRLFVSPVLLGGGTPYLLDPVPAADLELLESRTFSSGVVYLRYAVTPRA